MGKNIYDSGFWCPECHAVHKLGQECPSPVIKPTPKMISVDKQALLDVVRKLDFGAPIKDFPSSFDKLRLAFTRDEVATGEIK